MAGNSPMAGHPRTALGGYNKSLEGRSDVLYIDEFRTTQVCSACHTRAETSTPPHRYQQCMCEGKRRVWNRDNNAARNIKLLGNLIVHDKPRPDAFRRRFDLPTMPSINREKKRRAKREPKRKEQQGSDGESSDGSSSGGDWNLSDNVPLVRLRNKAEARITHVRYEYHPDGAENVEWNEEFQAAADFLDRLGSGDEAEIISCGDLFANTTSPAKKEFCTEAIDFDDDGGESSVHYLSLDRDESGRLVASLGESIPTYYYGKFYLLYLTSTLPLIRIN